MVAPGDIVIDCTGSRSLLRDHLAPGPAGGRAANTFSVHLEYAIVVTFLYGQQYVCNEYCKYDKNIENLHYKFIPAVDRTCYDGSTSHVTGHRQHYGPGLRGHAAPFDGDWLRGLSRSRPSMDRFIDKIKQETHGEILGESKSCGYRWTCTGLATRPAGSGVSGAQRPSVRHRAGVSGRRFGDGSPYFQSISLGFECAMYLAGLCQRDLALTRHARSL